MRTTYKSNNGGTTTGTLQPSQEVKEQVKEQVQQRQVQPRPVSPESKQRVISQQPVNADDLLRQAQKQAQESAIKNTVDADKKEEYQKLYMDMIEANEVQNSIDSANFVSEEIPKKSPIKKILIVLLVIAIAGGITYIKYRPSKDAVETETTEEVPETDVLATVKAEIDRLYTSGDKQDTLTDISQDSLSSIYSELTELEQAGNDISSVKAELDNISRYLEDKATVYGYMSVDTDLKTISAEQLTALRDSASTYIVPGLALTLTNNVASVEADLEIYNNLLAEMQAIEDYANYDSEKYTQAIAGITHNPNKLELGELHASLLLKQEEAKGKQELEDKAKEEADKAKDKALEEANEAKENAEKEVEETKDKLKKALEDAKNNVINSSEDTTEAAPTEAPAQ